MQARGWDKDLKQWFKGYYYEVPPPLECFGELGPPECFLIFENPHAISDWSMPRNMVRATVDQKSVGLCLGQKDSEGIELFQGDIIKNLKGEKMVIRYGEHEAFCPEDGQTMRGVGFYVESLDFIRKHMPVGPTEDYATKIGTEYEDPELLEPCWSQEV